MAAEDARPADSGAEAKPEGGEEGTGRRSRKRKSLWDTTGPDGATAGEGKDTASGAVAALTPEQLLLQQQQQLLQLRALAQAKAEAAAALQATQIPPNGANRVYVGSIFYDLTETDMLLAFSPFGQIIKIDMPKDSNTGKHKGFCFIEYTNPDAATAAIATMDGCQLAGRRIKVNRPNNVASAPSSATTIVNPLMLNQAIAMSPVAAAAAAAAANVATQAGTSGSPLQAAQLQAQAIANTISIQHGVMPAAPKPAANTRVYVGSIVYDLGESDVQAIFQAFGNIVSCQLIPNPETGKHKGYGFVEFETEEAAKGAIQCMNGFQLGGRQLKVGWASATNAPSGSSAAQAAAAAAPNYAQLSLPNPLMPGLPGAPLVNPLLAAGGVGSPASLLPQQTLFPPGAPPAPPVLPSPPAPPPPPPPGRCVLLNNMVGPDEVDDDLQSEVTDECGKFGKVEKVVIYQEQRSERPGDSVVKIFVLFASQAEASAAQKALHGRWFGGRQVNANFYPETYFVRDDFSH